MRLGSIKFINSLPVDLGIMSGAVSSAAEVIQGSPAELNAKILNDQLDVSPVSAFLYAGRQSEFLLLPDLSISSRSGVRSVLLFSRLKFRELERGRIAVTDKGRTTPVLLEVLCRLRYGFKPNLMRLDKSVNPWSPDPIPRDCDAVLLIGDEALLAGEALKARGADIEVVDLAEEWERWTKTPFVFAVWTARRDFWNSAAEEVRDIWQALLRSKSWGSCHMDGVLRRARRMTGLNEKALRFYFSGLSYDFGEDLRRGMRLYFEYATQCGLLGSVGEFEEITATRGRTRSQGDTLEIPIRAANMSPWDLVQ